MRKKHVPIKLWNGQIEYADDIYNKLFRNGTLTTTQTTAETSGKGLGSLVKKASLTEAKFKYISNPRENMGRVVGYLIERKNGADDLAASAITKGVFFDYLHSMTRSEQNIAKRFINPFYSWLKNNTRRQFELLFTRTGQYATVPKAMNFVENISDVPENYKEYREDYKNDLGFIATPFRQPGLPDWLADLVGKERTTKAGKMLEFNPNFAFQDWSRLNPKDTLASLPPTIKIPAELISNKNFYFGTDIDTNDVVRAPKVFENTIGQLPANWLGKIGIKKNADGEVYTGQRLDYFLKAANPTYALATRMFPAADKTSENTPYQYLSAFGGIKFTPYDEDKSKENYLKRFIENANNLSTNTEKITKEEQLKVKDYESALNYIYDQYAKQQTGYDKIEQLKEIIKLQGGSNKEIDLFIKLKSQPYNELSDKAKGLNVSELAALLKQVGIDPTYEDIITALQQKEAGK
jgi:hypothetical protein